MQHERSLGVVQAWQEAVNRQDVARLGALSSPDIEIAGPRGSGRGVDLLREWLDRAHLRLAPQQAFARGTSVVVAYHGVWHGATGAVAGAADFAAAFRVDHGRVTRFARYDSLDAALMAANLTPADEIPLTEQERDATAKDGPVQPD
ncbi:MAG: nuclear transport factor 2 family protein [Thermomicrobiales bacterium]